MGMPLKVSLEAGSLAFPIQYGLYRPFRPILKIEPESIIQFLRENYCKSQTAKINMKF